MTNVSRRVALRLLTALLLLVATGIAVARRVEAQPAQPAQPVGADRWLIYGMASSRSLDSAVPGRGVVAVQPRAEVGEPWSSGAGLTVPGAIASGERVTAVFSARATRPTQLTIALQGAPPGYTRFATAEVALTSAWQQVSVSGTAPADFAADTQSLSVPLGQTLGEVVLGPVAFLRGPPDRASVARAHLPISAQQ